MFKINDEIVHDVFGRGKILDIKSNEFCKIYKIKFSNSTEFVVSYDNLLMTKIENEENDIVEAERLEPEFLKELAARTDVLQPVNMKRGARKNYDLYILIFIVFFIFTISSLLIEYFI